MRAAMRRWLGTPKELDLWDLVLVFVAVVLITVGPAMILNNIFD